ncbi:hypothetical protein [Tomitella gaofuii]|uniref:hypothetical protein n=1 Tax=Tomitella gaofuii TaxID=2760083 RepID=UPI0015F9088D|nr:hypothetical protein [Tomitella gaofuii]
MIAAAAGLAIAGQGVASATTITPHGGEHVTATGTSTPALHLATNGHTLDCYTFEAEGNTPTAAGDDTITLQQNAINISYCYLDGTVPTTVTVNDDATLSVDYNGGSPQGTLSIPDGGITAVASDATGTCTLAVHQSDVGPVAYDNATGKAAAVNASGVEFTSTKSGSLSCPDSDTALATTTLQLDLDDGSHPQVGA